MEAGSEALVFVEDGGIVVLTRENAIRQAQGILRRAIGDFRGSLVDDLIAERRREVEQEERERSGRRRKSA